MITYDSIASMKLNRYIFDYNTKLNNINTQLKTGSSINYASDGPSEFNFSVNIKGYSQLYNTANQNATSGISMIDIGTSAIGTMKEKLAEIKTIAEKSSKNGITDEERASLQTEVNKLVKEIYDIKQNTGFNGLQIFELKTAAPVTPETPETPEVVEEASKFITEVVQKTDAELEDEGYIVVKTAQELIDAFNDDSSAAIALGADLDFTGIDFTPLGDEDNAFYGILEGNGYSIKNLTINSASENTGLFGYAESATISNIGLENVNVTGTKYVGALVGNAYGTTITNSFVSGGEVKGNYGIGGLVGYADTSEIEKSYAELDLVKANTGTVGGFIGISLKSDISQSFADTTIEGDSYLGGFSGVNTSSTITNSYANGELNGRDAIGGFSGANASTTISNSYASMEITGSTNIGGFIGELNGNAASNTVQNSFFDKEKAGVTNSVGSYNSSSSSQVATLQGLTTSAMQTSSTFTNAGWDSNVWVLEDGEYPQLKEKTESPFPEKEDEPEYLGRLQAVDGPIRVQTGKDNTTNSYVTVDTTFEFDDNFNFHVENKDFAKKTLENLEKVNEQLDQKVKDLNLSKTILESEAQTTSRKVITANNTLDALTGINENELQAEKTKLLADLMNAEALRDSSVALNAQVCKTLVFGAIYRNTDSSWLNQTLT